METLLYPEVAQDVKVLSQIVLYKFHMWKTCSLDIFFVTKPFVKTNHCQQCNVIIFGCQSIFCYPLSIKTNLHV